MKLNLAKNERVYIQKQVGAKPDGDLGPNTLEAIKKATTFTTDNKDKLITAFIQETYNKKNPEMKLVVDGIFGAMTDYAIGELAGTAKSSSSKPSGSYTDLKAQVEATPIILPSPLPRRATFDTKVATLGHPTKINQSQGKFLKRIKFTHYDMFYAGSKTSSTLVHVKAVDNFYAAFEGVAKAYDKASIAELKLNDYGGCYNYRKIRGGSAFSSHSYGTAIDLNAGDNRMRSDHTKARFASMEYLDFFKAFYAAGFQSLGIKSDFDWMHLEL